MLVHLSQPPRVLSGGPPPMLVLLHGYGSNEADLFGLAPDLDPRFQIVSLRAPTLLGGQAFGWFRLDFTPEGIRGDPAEARASHDLIVGEIDALIARYAVDPAQVYLAGFSQGAIMSATVALTRPEKIAGAVLMSGRILSEVVPAPEEASRLTGLPIMVVHGIYDDVLPIANGRASRDELQKLPVDLTYREYPIAHRLSPESLSDAARWLTTRLDAGPRSS